MRSIRYLALAVVFLLLDACAARTALRGTGDAGTAACPLEEPCFEGGSSDTIALGIGAVALVGLLGTGALIHQLSRSALGAQHPATSAPARSPSPNRRHPR